MRIDELERDGRFPPTRNDMPELDAACTDDLFVRCWFALSFEREDWLTGDEKWTLVNQARLTDKAVREYRAARECLSAFVDARPATPAPDRTPGAVSVEAIQQFMRAADHLETCVSTVKRASRFFYHAVEFAGRDPAIFDEVFLPLKRLRDNIEHADRDLKERGIEGEPLFVVVLAESVYFYGVEVPYLSLKAGIQILHSNAGFLIDGTPAALDLATGVLGDQSGDK
jgi:hypothetical protein